MNEEKGKNAEMADFRYSVIADLANPYLDAAKRRQLTREKADRHWNIPGSDASGSVKAASSNGFRCTVSTAKRDWSPNDDGMPAVHERFLR